MLDLTSPAPRGYRARGPRPRRAHDYRHLANAVAWLGALVSITLIGYVTVFTPPGRTENILAFVALVGFGGFFFAWAVGAWLRTSDEESAPPPAKWTVTRQAFLFAVGTVALATAAVNRIVSPASVVLVVLVVLSAELLLRRMRLSR